MIILAKTSRKRSFSFHFLFIDNVFSLGWIQAWFWKRTLGVGEMTSRHIVSKISLKSSEFARFWSILQFYKEPLKNIIYITRRPMKQGFRFLCQILAEGIFSRLFIKMNMFWLSYLLLVHRIVYFDWAPSSPPLYTVIPYSVHILHRHERRLNNVVFGFVYYFEYLYHLYHINPYLLCALVS